MQSIKYDEEHFVEIPKFYDFGDEYNREDILYRNFEAINDDIESMCQELMAEVG